VTKFNTNTNSWLRDSDKIVSLSWDGSAYKVEFNGVDQALNFSVGSNNGKGIDGIPAATGVYVALGQSSNTYAKLASVKIFNAQLSAAQRAAQFTEINSEYTIY
jgi:hypothetical protein